MKQLALPAPVSARLPSKRTAIYAVAALLVGLTIFGADTDTASAPDTAVAPTTAKSDGRQPAERPVSFDLPARVLAADASVDLFSRHSWFVPPPPAPPAPPAKPTAPPLPYTLLGSYAAAGDKPVYFLVNGDRVHDVHVGDVLDSTYKVDGESNGQLTFTYLPLGTQQSLSVGR